MRAVFVVLIFQLPLHLRHHLWALPYPYAIRLFWLTSLCTGKTDQQDNLFHQTFH